MVQWRHLNSVGERLRVANIPHLLRCLFFIQFILPLEWGWTQQSTNSVVANQLVKIKKEVVKAVSKATVTIETPVASGSGFFYKDADGFWVVTNTHVVGDAYDPQILKVCDQNGKKIALENTIKGDLEADLCMLKLAHDETPLSILTEGDDPSPEDRILAEGNALGDGVLVPLEGTITGLGSKKGVAILEISAPIVPGCSGGPVVNEKGELLGISTYSLPPGKILQDDERFKGTPFPEVRRMAVRSNRLKNLKPLELAQIFINHKANRDRISIFEFYLIFISNRLGPEQQLNGIQSFLATADKPVLEQLPMGGIHKSGMLNDYFDALEALLKRIKDLGENRERLRRQLDSLMGPKGLMEIPEDWLKREQDDEERVNSKFEKDLLSKLKTKQDFNFVSQEMHDSIDDYIDKRLKVLEARIPAEKFILESKPPLSPLMDAVEKGDVSKITRVLEDGAPPNTTDPDGWTALMHACQIGNAEVIQALLNKGGDVETKDPGGWNALLLAANYGKAPIVQLLLAHHADPKAKTKKGTTALMSASGAGHMEVVHLLLEAGSEVNAKDDDGKTALYYAIKKDHRDIVEILKKSGAVE